MLEWSLLMKPEMTYELRVLTGLHRGAALPLTGGEWSIGSSSSVDLVLYDPGIKDRHCILQRVSDSWSLARKEGQVTDSEGHKVDAIASLQPGTPFAINGVWLSVVSANTEWPKDEDEQPQPEVDTKSVLQELSSECDKARPKQLVAQSRSLLGSTLLLGASILFLGALFSGLNREELKPSLPAMPSHIPLKDAAAVHEVLKRMLQERELQTKISIADEKGKIFLKGRFDEDDLLQSTERMLLRFEQQYKSPLQVLSDLPEATPLLPFSIVQISNARLPSVLTSDGHRLFLGDEVQGVRFVDISDHQLVFEGDRRIEVSW
ncbi:FHA domain-containing protein [Pseudomonas chlororaphis]|uniref:FHA domain-containing protein n=1 Tax=Pseudomonas chlororaphis TaxID=587753 RepID=UPI000F6E939C|nr:FHA domain-containing protein [Pseudomonas chlororaphis]AZC84003.1 type III secretion protein HrpQ [Pseudomonas chlororaphis subsp. piscium]